MCKPQTAEQKATASFLAVGAAPCQTFAPHYPTHYLDKKGSLNEHKPDFYTYAFGNHIFFESKCGGATRLNAHQSKETCRKALMSQYKWRFKRDPGDMSHSKLSVALWDAGYHNDCLDHGWNHSLTKHLLTQRIIGRESYMIVFTKPPTLEDAANYTKKGLAYITIGQLAKFLTPA